MHGNVRWYLAVCAMLFCLSSLQARPDEDAWAGYRFLIGNWVGEGSGGPGQGSGEFSLAFGLDKKVLIRKNRSDYPAANGRPAVHHEDLMVIYRGDDGKPSKAIYFDNEAHVIEYKATGSDDHKTLTFVSDARPSAPRFRLTYTKSEGETVKIKFEIAPPGKPEEFKTYLEGSARRKMGAGIPRVRGEP